MRILTALIRRQWRAARGIKQLKGESMEKKLTNKVLVTGASGLLGVAAIEKFLSAGWEGAGASRGKPNLPSSRKMKFRPADLRTKERARAGSKRLLTARTIATPA